MKTVFVLLSILLVSGCLSSLDTSPNESTDKYFCGVDTDCVAEQCCHATTSINKQFAPTNCDDLACTLECAPHTLDCGAATIQCVENKCAVVPLLS